MSVIIKQDKTVLPLTNGQLSFWYIYQLTQETTNHVMPYRFTGELCGEQVERVINALLRDHEIFRAAASDWCAEQTIYPYQVMHLPLSDVSELPLAHKQQSLATMYTQLVTPNFDLTKPPLLRARLIKETPQSHLLLLVFPHFAMDGAALHQFDLEFRRLYQKAQQGESLRQHNKLLLSEYIVQEQQARAQQSGDAKRFWQQQLQGIEPCYLPLHFLDSENQLRRSTFISLNDAQMALINQYCERYQVTQQMLFLGIIAQVMSEVTGNQSLCLTTVQENRDINGSRELLATLLTSLPIALRFSEQQNFAALLQQVKETTLAVYQYRHVPWSIPLSILAEQRLTTSPWWLKGLRSVTGLYHRLSRRTGLYPEALADFATIAAADMAEDQALKKHQQRRAMTINVNMLPSFYEPAATTPNPNGSSSSPSSLSLCHELDFPMPEDNCEWELDVLNFYIEKHPTQGAGIRFCHQCLNTEGEAAIERIFYQVLLQQAPLQALSEVS